MRGTEALLGLRRQQIEGLLQQEVALLWRQAGGVGGERLLQPQSVRVGLAPVRIGDRRQFLGRQPVRMDAQVGLRLRIEVDVAVGAGADVADEVALANGQVVEMADGANALQLEGAQAVAERAEISDVAEPAPDEFLSPDNEEGTPPAIRSGSAFLLGCSARCADACGALRDPGMSAGLVIPAQGLEPY